MAAGGALAWTCCAALLLACLPRYPATDDEAFPRELHLIASPSAAAADADRLRGAYEERLSGWSVHYYAAEDLAREDAALHDRLAGAPWEQRASALALSLLRRRGGVCVVGAERYSLVGDLDGLVGALHPSVDFFAGAEHPALAASRVDECRRAGLATSEAVKRCGMYIPVALHVMGARRGSRLVSTVLGRRWEYATSPAEEIMRELDGAQVLLNWRYFGAPEALASLVPEAVLAVAGGMDGRWRGEPRAPPARTPCAEGIPRIIHQVWISSGGGAEAMPERVRRMVDGVRDAHPSWEHHTWGDELYEMYADEVPAYYRTDPRVPPAVVSDHFRVLLLRDYGGVALDADAASLVPLDGLLDAMNAAGATFFAGANFPKPRGGNKVGLVGGPPLAFVAIGAARCAGVLAGMLDAALPEGRWYWPSQVEGRPEWAVPLHNGWGLALEAMAWLDGTARVLSYRFFSDTAPGPHALLDHNRHHLWSWIGDFRAWKAEQREAEAAEAAARRGGGEL